MSWDWDKLKQSQGQKVAKTSLGYELWLTFWVVILRPLIVRIGIFAGFVILGLAFGLGFWTAKTIIM